MTRKIFINVVAASVLFVTSQVMAANATPPTGTDMASVAFFQKLFPSPKCSVDQMTKTMIVYEQENKCLVRVKATGGSYFAGYKSGCNESMVRQIMDVRVTAYCNQKERTLKAEKEREEKAAAEAKKAAAEAAKNAPKSTQASAKDLKSTYKDMEKDYDKKAAKADGKMDDGKEGWDKAKEKIGGFFGGGDDKKSTTSNSKVLGEKTDQAVNQAKVNEPEVKDSREDRPLFGSKTEYGSTNDEFSKNAKEQLARQDELDKMEDERNRFAAAKDGACFGQHSGSDTCKKATANYENFEKQQQEANAKKLDEEIKKNDEKVAVAEKEKEKIMETASPQQKEDAEVVDSEKAQQEAQKTDEQVAKEAQEAEAEAKRVEQQGKQPLVEAEATSNIPEGENCKAEIQQLESDWREYAMKRAVCKINASISENFCEKLRSPKYRQVQKYMVIGAAALSKVTAASESCDTISKLSMVSSVGVLAAQGICLMKNKTCDSSCDSAKNQLSQVKKSNDALKACNSNKMDPDMRRHEQLATKYHSNPYTQQLAVNEDAIVVAENSHIVAIGMVTNQYDQMIAQEKRPSKVEYDKDEKGNQVTAKVKGGSDLQKAAALCRKKHKADYKAMLLAGFGMYEAHKDAEKCKKQLSSVSADGAGAAKAVLTTAEFCSSPSNANNLTCKCTVNPSAEGCIGSMASGSGGVSIDKLSGGGKGSGFAGFGPGLGSDPIIGSSDKKEAASATTTSGLSDAAREALGLGGGSGGGSGGGFGGRGGGFGGSGSGSGKKAAEVQKGKFGFFSNIGNLFGGSKKSSSASAGKSSTSSNKKDLELVAKRKIASEQLRAEISTASGKSNFDKVKARYQSESPRFEQ